MKPEPCTHYAREEYWIDRKRGKIGVRCNVCGEDITGWVRPAPPPPPPAPCHYCGCDSVGFGFFDEPICEGCGG